LRLREDGVRQVAFAATDFGIFAFEFDPVEHQMALWAMAGQAALSA
jgi:hypothetical protein